MDFLALSPALQFLSAVAAILTALCAFVGVPKIMSDLGLNRVAQRRHMAELIEALTSREKNQPVPHPMVIQAQFHAAFGGEAWRIPPGKDLHHFLTNPTLATLQTARSLAASLALVTYSELANGFTPGESWTVRKLAREHTCQHIAYWAAAIPTIFCFVFWGLAPSLPWFMVIGAIYTFSKAYRAGQIHRAMGLLKMTPASGQ